MQNTDWLKTNYSDDKAAALALPPPCSGGRDESSLRSDLLISFRADVLAMIKTELRAALTEDFDFIKSELQAVRTELMNTTASLRAELDLTGYFGNKKLPVLPL